MADGASKKPATALLPDDGGTLQKTEEKDDTLLELNGLFFRKPVAKCNEKATKSPKKRIRISTGETADSSIPAAASENSLKVQEYKDSLKSKAEDLILKGFPKKIVELNELLDTAQFGRQDLTEVHQPLNIPVPDPVVINSHVTTDQPASKKWKYDNCVDAVTGTKVMALPSGAVPCNKHLCDLVNVVKPHIRQLVEDTNLLKMWISFMIPKIEDGNNFGVSIQEDTLAEIQSVESEAAAFFDQISRYFVSRAKVVSKVAKYPHIEDYRRAVQELDEKEYVSLLLVMCEVRNRYCTLHDIVIKNLEKLKKPRTSNAETLY